MRQNQKRNVTRTAKLMLGINFSVHRNTSASFMKATMKTGPGAAERPKVQDVGHRESHPDLANNDYNLPSLCYR